MDGLSRKSPAERPIEPSRHRQMPTSIKPAKKEELYITKEDSALMQTHEKKIHIPKNSWKKIWITACLLLFITLAYFTFFLWKAYSVSKKMNSDNSRSQQTFTQEVRSMISPIVPESGGALRGQDQGRINILLFGAAGQHNPGENLTDTIMIMSIDTKNMKIALLSLPRDLYVNIPGTSSFSKINSLYKIGLDQGQGVAPAKEAIEKITGISINYYIALDFEGFKKIIDDIGGVNVMVPRDMHDARYPGPNYSYETFDITKGFHALDGNTALKYVRERHDDPLGDFGRAKRQQQVIQAVKNKFFSLQTLFNVVGLNNILDTLGDNIKTDITFDDIDKLLALSKKVDTQNITNSVVDAWNPDSLLKVSHVQMGNATAFILIPRVGNYSEIQDLAQNIFNQNEIKKRQDAIKTENARIAVINKSSDVGLPKKIQQLLTGKLGMKNVSIIPSTSKDIAPDTTVADNRNGANLFTLDELIKKLPARIASQSVAGGPATLDKNANASANYDIIITLGNDLSDIYKYEEDTLQDLQNSEN